MGGRSEGEVGLGGDCWGVAGGGVVEEQGGS